MSADPPNGQQNNSSGEAPAAANTSAPVSGNTGRIITEEDVKLVQNLIERCIQLYMDKIETMNYLLSRAGIELVFTQLVWEKLEEDNPEFFRSYYIRLALTRQIDAFNKLLECQCAMMKPLAEQNNLPSPADVQNATHHHQIPVNNGAAGCSSFVQPQILSSLGNPPSFQSTSESIPTNGGSNMIPNSNLANEGALECKLENATSLTTMEFSNQLPLPSTQIPELNADASQLNSTISSNKWYQQNGSNMG